MPTGKSTSKDPAFRGNSREGYGTPIPDDPTREVNWSPVRGRFGGPDHGQTIEESYGTDWEDDIEPVWQYNTAMPPIPFDQFMAQYPQQVQQLAAEVRRFVMEALPDAVEQVDPPSKIVAYGAGPKMADTVCVISPLKDSINLGFYRAVELPDPAGLLEGTGKLHRHVKIRTLEDLQNPALKDLLTAAISAKQR